MVYMDLMIEEVYSHIASVELLSSLDMDTDLVNELDYFATLMFNSL